MELKLNIYKNSKEVEKTYISNECDIMFGTCENIISLMDLDFLNDDDNTQLVVMATKIVRGSLNEVKDLLKEVFPEVTDDELKHTKVKELVNLILEIVKFTFTGIADVGKKKLTP
jgi:hypothetical protein